MTTTVSAKAVAEFKWSAKILKDQLIEEMKADGVEDAEEIIQRHIDARRANIDEDWPLEELAL